MYHTSPTMPFGKHRGRQLCDVPTSYLAWAARECLAAPPWLLAAIREELARRAAPRRPPPGGSCPRCERIAGEINAQFRQLSLACHPDRGGDDKVMAAVNNAYEKLRAVLPGECR